MYRPRLFYPVNFPATGSPGGPRAFPPARQPATRQNHLYLRRQLDYFCSLNTFIQIYISPCVIMKIFTRTRQVPLSVRTKKVTEHQSTKIFLSLPTTITIVLIEASGLKPKPAEKVIRRTAVRPGFAWPVRGPFRPFPAAPCRQGEPSLRLRRYRLRLPGRRGRR